MICPKMRTFQGIVTLTGFLSSIGPMIQHFAILIDLLTRPECIKIAMQKCWTIGPLYGQRLTIG